MFRRFIDFISDKIKISAIVGIVGAILVVGWILWSMFIKPKDINIVIKSFDDEVTFTLASEIKATANYDYDTDDNGEIVTEIEYNIVKYSDFIEQMVLTNEFFVEKYVENDRDCYLFYYSGYHFKLEHVKNRKFIFSNLSVVCDCSYQRESYEKLAVPFVFSDCMKYKDEIFAENNYRMEYRGYFDSFEKVLEYYKKDKSGYSRISYNDRYIYLFGIIQVKRGSSTVNYKSSGIVARVYDDGSGIVLDCSKAFTILG